MTFLLWFGLGIAARDWLHDDDDMIVAVVWIGLVMFSRGTTRSAGAERFPVELVGMSFANKESSSVFSSCLCGGEWPAPSSILPSLLCGVFFLVEQQNECIVVGDSTPHNPKISDAHRSQTQRSLSLQKLSTVETCLFRIARRDDDSLQMFHWGDESTLFMLLVPTGPMELFLITFSCRNASTGNRKRIGQ
jgi:hypothetical protein